jgi:hypothetical protein
MPRPALCFLAARGVNGVDPVSRGLLRRAENRGRRPDQARTALMFMAQIMERCAAWREGVAKNKLPS